MKLFKTALTFIAALGFSGLVSAAAVNEGQHYKVISPAQTTVSETDKIEVVEIFSYGCSHCHRFEPALERWLKTKPDNVEFVRLPAMFNKNLEPFARAYYAAEALGVVDKVHHAFFEAVHLAKRRITNDAAIADIFEENGVSRKKAMKALRSPYVASKVKRAVELTQRYGIEATPSMVINGKYRTNPGMDRQGFKGMLKTVDHLIAQQ